MNFAEAAKNEARFTKTENGAVALNTTGSALLDLYATGGALREADEDRIKKLFVEAYKEDPLIATKITFYIRDRIGLGERRTFRTIIKYMAEHHPEAIRPNIDLIGAYGRYDDLYSLVGTPVEDDMWVAMKKQFEVDLKALNESDKNAISLLAKWIKSADTSSAESRRLGVLTAKKLGYPVYNFKRIVRSMRKRINIVEAHMSAGEWDQINYSAVPSRAMMIYRNAFKKHDTERYNEFINKAITGEVKINSSTLFPYDLVAKILDHWNFNAHEDKTVEAQWRQLPNYVEEGTNALVMADTSGSMDGRPIYTAMGLAIYFAERNKGAYHNMWMSFSSNPNIHVIKGETLAQKINSIDTWDWKMNTNLHAAFMKVLDIAIQNNVPQEEMPKSLIVISDMEIDACGDRDWSFYDQMAAEYKAHGYEIPNIIFWQVNSRHDIFHADATRKGVQLVGGQSATIFKQVMDCVGMTPVEAMMKTINSERYDSITIERKE